MRSFYFLWIYSVTLIALAAASIISLFEERHIINDTTSRASALAASLEDSIVLNYTNRNFSRISKQVERLRHDHRLVGIAICNSETRTGIGFPKSLTLEKQCSTPMTVKTYLTHRDANWIQSSPKETLQFYSHSLDAGYDEDPHLFLIVTQDVSHIRKLWLAAFIRVFASTEVAGILLVLLVTSQIQGWIKSNFKIVRNAIRSIPFAPKKKEEQTWFQSLQSKFKNQNLVVIANREPYIHEFKKDKIELIRPASGLVTALEPILRQLGGLWIAHGGGSADRVTSDKEGSIQVPPLNPTYTLRRVWLTPEEEMGYYYGFSNEGLWPLCHLAHNRPIFRLADWEYYKEVNQRFSEKVPVDSVTNGSIVLVQDYHFALLPRLIKNRRSHSRSKIGLFWHIPWPNPEAFGICPWGQELLRGMLGSDIIGFHTQYHCNNFLETCNRYLEARIDWENFSVTMDHHETLIRAFPIGIDTAPVRTLSDEEVKELKIKYGITSEIVAVGVDRLDYTKGLIERVEAVERLLEKYPQYIGRFSLVQMGSPSRTHIPAYRFLNEQLEKAVNRVNHRFQIQSGGKITYLPVIFLNQHHQWDEIQYFYQIGDLCMVTSLHDGMNLVAKEYVWCQRPDRGSLILSKFAGASRELTEAFIVNPYSIEELADSIAAAITLPRSEKQRRMLAMKDKIEKHNAFHWASDLIQALISKEDRSRPSPPAQIPLSQFRSPSQPQSKAAV